DDAHPEQKRVERVDILCPGGFFLHHRVSARPFASSDSRGTRIEYGRADPWGRTGAVREAPQRRASRESTSSRDVASGPVVRATASQPRSRRPDAMAEPVLTSPSASHAVTKPKSGSIFIMIFRTRLYRSECHYTLD